MRLFGHRSDIHQPRPSAGVATGGTGETTLLGGNSVRVRGFGGGGTAGALGQKRSVRGTSKYNW